MCVPRRGIASSKFATAQLVCPHLEEGRTLLRWELASQAA